MSTRRLPHAPLDCISRVRFAPGSKTSHLLVSSWDANVRLYDMSCGALVGMQRTNLAVLDCTFVDDASRCVAVGLDRRVVWFDFQSQQELVVGSHDEAIRCVEFDPGVRRIVTGSWDRTLRLWDVRQGVARVGEVVKVGTKVFALDVGVNRIIVAGADRHIHIFDSRRLDAALERRASGLKQQLRAAKVSLDQRSFASSSVEGRVAIELFDPEENKELKYAFKCHREKTHDGGEVIHAVNAIAIHPVHGTFATGGSDGSVCVWDGYARKRLCRLNSFDTSVSSLCFSNDGTMLACGVSYTFDKGENVQPPAPEIVLRYLTDAEVLPKTKQ